jgi:hypothetical protein
MFTMTVRTIDRTEFISVTTDDVTDRSTRRWAPQSSEANETTYCARTCRTLFASTALSPGIYGKNAASIAMTPVSIFHSERTLLADSTTFHGESVGEGTQSRRNSRCEYHSDHYRRDRCHDALHPSLAVTHTAAHEFPRVRSASPCPSGPGIITRGDLWPFFSMGSC